MSPLNLESELKRVAAEADWSRVVHRCAWCRRVDNGHGEYLEASEDTETVGTDGMCPRCARRALKVIAMRRPNRERLAA
jgi:hypothetical protein